MNEQYEPRTDDKGIYERRCPVCETEFRTNNPRTVYCSETCKSKAAFARAYEKQSIRDKIIARVKRNKKKG